MKVAIDCKSLLLKKSLEIFLDKHLTSLKNCDIVIKDTLCKNNEKCFYISSDKNSDLVKPFSKAQLMLALENRYHKINNELTNNYINGENSMDFSILEKRIDLLTQEYKENILKAVQAFYEE